MIVICLEGCHGSGKTSVLSELATAGFNVLDEAFIDMPSYTKDLHPQSLMMESMWVCQWFERLLRKKSNMDDSNEADQIFFADRSPYSAVFYSRNGGHLLSPLIREQIKELAHAAQIEIHTVYIKVRPSVLWKRIQARLLEQPGRLQFNENKREWMDQTLDFYDNFTWDCDIDNSDCSVPAVMENLVSMISRRSPRFQRIVSTDGGGDPASPVEANFSPRVRAASICSADDVSDDTASSSSTAQVTPATSRSRRSGISIDVSAGAEAEAAFGAAAAGEVALVTPEASKAVSQSQDSPDTVTHLLGFSNKDEAAAETTTQHHVRLESSLAEAAE